MQIPSELLLLFSLGDDGMTIRKLSQRADMVYSYVHKKVVELERKGLVETTKIGRKRIVSVTPKGRKVRELYREFLIEWNI